MSRRLLGAALAAWVTASAGAASAADLVYTHGAGAHEALRVYNGKPYWAMLADCSGFVTAMGQWDQLRGNARDAQSAKEVAAHLLMRSVNRYAADRRVSAQVALQAVQPNLTGARAAGGRRLAQGGAAVQRIYDTMGSMCQSGATGYDRMSR